MNKQPGQSTTSCSESYSEVNLEHYKVFYVIDIAILFMSIVCDNSIVKLIQVQSKKHLNGEVTHADAGEKGASVIEQYVVSFWYFTLYNMLLSPTIWAQ